jgi:hypothetical protein
MRCLLSFIATALIAAEATVFVIAVTGTGTLNGRQFGLAAAVAGGAVLLRAMWLTPGGWHQRKWSPGLPPVDGAPLNDRDRLILAQIEGHMNGTNCVCGCPRKVHQHHRSGSDCSTCSCRVYRKPGRLRRFLDRRGVRQVQKAGYRAWDQRTDRWAK